MQEQLRYNSMKGMARRPRINAGRGFTIVELLLVVGIIIVLLSIVIVAVNAAMRTAQSANTQSLMASISKGLVQFKSDIGYLPPVLGPADPMTTTDPRDFRNYSAPPIPPLTSATADVVTNYITNEIQSWYSYTSLAEYLLGYGDATEDGYGANNPLHETDGPLGIRHPGPDGYWGVAPTSGGAGTLFGRQDLLPTPEWERFLRGRSYGPYLELRDERLLGALLGVDATGRPRIAFPGEASYDDTAPKVIVDYWGEPIRYYRKPYVPGSPGQDYRIAVGAAGHRTPMLSDVFVLRPFTVREGDAIDGVPDLTDPTGEPPRDTTTTFALQTASFGLLSSGPNRRIDERYRADPEEYNRDNIVELGR